jgi:hypothetical protein
MEDAKVRSWEGGKTKKRLKNRKVRRCEGENFEKWKGGLNSACDMLIRVEL